MRIISSFQDYYDSVQAYGYDEQVIFHREPSAVPTPVALEVPLPWMVRSSPHTQILGCNHVTLLAKEAPKNRFNNDQNGAYHLVEGFVLLGGRAHSIWLNRIAVSSQYYLDQSLRPSRPASALERLIYEGPLGHPDLATASAWWDKQLREQMPPLLSPDQELIVKWRKFDKPSALRDKNSYAAARQKFLDKDWSSLQLEYGSPVLLLVPPVRQRWSVPSSDDHGKLIVNPHLASFHLQRSPAFDPYTVFQALAQFIGGVMPGAQAPLITLSDHTQVIKKGFDPVYGFRTRPRG